MLRRLIPFAALLAAAPAWADVTVSSELLFDENTLSLRDDAAVSRFLDEVGERLREDRDRTIRIEVHTDERLGVIDNSWLAGKRARNLFKAIKKRGARGKQVVTEAVGHSGVKPIPDTHRIVFDFSDDATVAPPGRG